MRCDACWATGPFLVTADRILHLGRGHVGKVEDRDERPVEITRDDQDDRP